MMPGWSGPLMSIVNGKGLFTFGRELPTSYVVPMLCRQLKTKDCERKKKLQSCFTKGEKPLIYKEITSLVYLFRGLAATQ